MHRIRVRFEHRLLWCGVRMCHMSVEPEAPFLPLNCQGAWDSNMTKDFSGDLRS